MGLISHYIRRFIRSHFNPVQPIVAKKWELNTTIVYFLAAWSALGLSIYAFIENYKKNKDSPYAQGKAFTPYQSMRKFGSLSDTITLIKITGTQVETEVLTYEEAKEKSRV